jgi:hypothetical protein
VADGGFSAGTALVVGARAAVLIRRTPGCA